jgi:hypothetical protein
MMIVIFAALAGCGGAVSDVGESEAELRGRRWQQTCGDVVCRGWSDKGIRPCTDAEKLDTRCHGSDECDPHSECNQLYVCQSKTISQVCPISRKKFKTDIDYVDQQERVRLHDELMRFRLAKYRYKDKELDQQHLGFMIDDVEPSPSVKGDHVDLYGYTSMAVAALQEQAKQIEMLRSEIATLRRELHRKK